MSAALEHPTQNCDRDRFPGWDFCRFREGPPDAYFDGEAGFSPDLSQLYLPLRHAVSQMSYFRNLHF